MNARMSARLRRGIVAAVAMSALVVPTAVAAGRGGGGSGGGGVVETASNSLSVPAVFVGTNPFSLTCDGTSAAPSGDPSTGFELPGYFYVQGVNTWQAGCVEGYDAATARAEWGDNLSGDAKLKVGSPIRVEVGLLADQAVPEMTGWSVVKLNESQLDRVSPYGTEATPTDTGYVSQPVTPYPETRVWAKDATLTIWKVGAEETPVYSGTAGAEINATGRVVYGYNLRVSSAGDYVIRYTFPGVTISGSDAGTYEGGTVTLPITVSPGGGGGGRR